MNILLSSQIKKLLIRSLFLLSTYHISDQPTILFSYLAVAESFPQALSDCPTIQPVEIHIYPWVQFPTSQSFDPSKTV